MLTKLIVVLFHNICKSSHYAVCLKLSDVCQLYLSKTGKESQGGKRKVVEAEFKPSVTPERTSAPPLTPVAVS